MMQRTDNRKLRGSRVKSKSSRRTRWSASASLGMISGFLLIHLLLSSSDQDDVHMFIG